MTDDPLDTDFYRGWTGYKEDKLSDVRIDKGKEVLVVRDREVTPGFMKWWAILVDSRDVQISFHIDKNVKWDRTIDELINLGHQNFKLQAVPFLSRMDTQNNEYAVTFDPPKPIPYTSELKLKVRNLNATSPANIKKAYIQRVIPIIDKQIGDPLKELLPQVSPLTELKEADL
jgi:hypothetical protein